MRCSMPVVSVLSLVGLAAIVGACGGKIEQSAANARPSGSGPYAGSAGADPVGSTPSKTPSGTRDGGVPTAPGASPPGSSSDGRGPTYVNGPLGFEVHDAFSFDSGPSANRELHGVWLTSWSNACDKRNASTGAGVLRIDFSEESGTVPSGTYPLEGPAPADLRTAFAQAWFVSGADCSAQGDPGASFESGTVTITRSDASGLVGSFQGIMVKEGAELAIDGVFDAPRCARGADSCTPPP